MLGLIVIVVLFALMWLFILGPQRRRQRETQAMLDALEVGDEVVTAGGIYGRITALDDRDAQVEIAPGLTVKVARRAIAGLVGAEVAAAELPGQTEPEVAGEAETGPPERS